MSLVGLCSAHGSPGVTTATLALGAVWPRDEPVAIEADPFGGVLAARFSLGESPALVSLAASARPHLTVEGLRAGTQRLPGDLAVVVGLASPEEGYRVLHDLATPLAGIASGPEAEVDVFVDAGRVPPSGDPGPLLRVCDLVLVVSRPVVDQVRLAAHRVHRLAGTVPAAMLLVGDRPYGPDEVGETLQVEVAGVVAWDPHGAALINGTSPTMLPARGRNRLSRLLLTRSVRSLSDALCHRLGVAAAVPAAGGAR